MLDANHINLSDVPDFNAPASYVGIEDAFQTYLRILSDARCSLKAEAPQAPETADELTEISSMMQLASDLEEQILDLARAAEETSAAAIEPFWQLMRDLFQDLDGRLAHGVTS